VLVPSAQRTQGLGEPAPGGQGSELSVRQDGACNTLLDARPAE